MQKQGEIITSYSLSLFITYILVDPKCCQCQKMNAAIWCDNCYNNYCPTCCEEVHKQRESLQHRIINISEKPSGMILCQSHPDEKIRFWCYNCEKLVCRDCAMLQHRNHNYVSINKAANDLSPQVSIQLYFH
jgi:hypothetical protein